MQYVIKKGDTLWGIARDNNTTVDALAKANNIANPNLIYAGNTIYIPDPPSAVSASAPVVSAKSSASPYSAPKPVYTASKEVTAAADAVSKWEREKPGEYLSKYESDIASLLDSILNREDFYYDYSDDPLYNAYKDSYVTLGRLAMEDAVGDASALSGGYANSYAQNAGQTAYQTYLTKLSGVIPSLMEAAYRRYRDEGETLAENLSLLRGLDSDDYSKYRDKISDYYSDGKHLLDKYSKIADDDYAVFSDLLASWQKEQDAAKEAERYEREMAYKAERDRIKDEQWAKDYALSLAKASSSNSSASRSSSSSRSSSKKSSGADNSYLSYDSFSARAKELADMLSSPKSYLADGSLKPAVLNTIKKARSSKEISREEYDYLMNMINR